MGTGLTPLGEKQVNFSDVSGDGLTGAQADPAVTALSNGNFVVVYEDPFDGTANIDLLAHFFDANGNAISPPATTTLANGVVGIDRNIAVTNHPAIAATANGGFVVAYTDATNEDIDVRTYNAVSGISSPFTVASPGGNPNIHGIDNAAIATFADGSMLVAFEVIFSATDHDVWDGILNSTGTGFVVTVNSVTSDNAFEGESRVATFGNTGALVFARDPGTIGGGQDIVLEFLNSTGTALASPTFVFGTNSSDVWSHPDVAALSDGRFIVTAQDDTTGGIAAAICDPTTHTVTPVLSVGGSNNAHVAGVPGDGFVVTFDSSGDVFEVRGAASGVLSTTGLVESFTTGIQDQDAIAASASGTVFFAWQDTGSGNPNSTDSDTRIEAQAFQVQLAVPADFNADEISDVLWRNSTDDSLVTWLMNGAAISSAAFVTSGGSVVAPDPSWGIVGIGDFNGNGDADVLWRQSSTGSLVAWLMNGSTIAASAFVTSGGNAVAPDASWSVAGIGDFNGDGDADMLWRQSTTGSLATWAMNGSAIASSVFVTFGGSAAAPDSTWSVAGIDDFNGDGKTDLLWRQGTTGSLVEWVMNGSAIASSTFVTSGGSAVAPDASWSVVGVGDFNGDDEGDVLWRQSTTGSLATWLMNGSAITSSAFVTSGGSTVAPDASWNIVEVGDFISGGTASILWQQSTTGALAEWQMNGSQIVSSQTVTSQGNGIAPSSSWQVQARPTDFV